MPRRHMPDFLQGLWSSALSLCIINEHGFVEDANLAMGTTLGYARQQLIGSDIMLLLAQGDSHKTRTLRQQFTDKRHAIAQGVWQLRSASGCPVPLQVLGSWITKREGNLYKLVVLVHEACVAEGNALLERHILDTPHNYPQNPQNVTDTTSKHPPDSADATKATPKPGDIPDLQRLRQRVIMLEGQVFAYKAALERYKVPAGIRFEEGAWYIQLPKVDDPPTEAISDED